MGHHEQREAGKPAGGLSPRRVLSPRGGLSPRRGSSPHLCPRPRPPRRGVAGGGQHPVPLPWEAGDAGSARRESGGPRVPEVLSAVSVKSQLCSQQR